MGAVTVLQFGMNWRRYPLMPSRTRTSSAVVGRESWGYGVDLAWCRPRTVAVDYHPEPLHHGEAKLRLLEVDGETTRTDEVKHSA